MLVLEGACCSESAMQNSGMGRLGDKTEEELKVEGVMKTALNILLHDQRSEHEAVKIVTLLRWSQWSRNTYYSIGISL